MENAPGPIIASVPPSVASIAAVPASPGDTKTVHTIIVAMIAPAIGVHKPIMMKIARAASMACAATVAAVAGSWNRTVPTWSRAMPVITL